MRQEGYNMAKNLQSKLPSSDTLVVQDINKDATAAFLKETQSASGGATVKVADSAHEACEQSVSTMAFSPEHRLLCIF
jgi:hypothetical protein